MRQFFYQTRNISGLILIISPILGAVSADRPFLFFLLLLAGAASSVPVLCASLIALPFRRWIRICSLLTLLGLSGLSGLTPQWFSSFSAFLLGMSCGGLLLLLPPVLTIGWFRRSKTFVLGCVWSCSFLLSFPWQALFRSAEDSILPAACVAVCGGAFLSIAAGLFLFLQRPPVDYRRRENPLIQGRHSIYARPSIFTGALAAALGIALSLWTASDGAASGSDADTGPENGMISFFLFRLLPLGILSVFPFLTALFIERKGVFSGCVLLIFLCESTLVCLGSPDGSPLSAVGLYFLAAAAGGFPVVLPVLVFYLYGFTGYPESLSRLLFFFPAGLLASLPFCYLAMEGQLSSQDAAIFLLCLLVLSFFCIFSAWKHRFIILKNTRM